MTTPDQEYDPILDAMEGRIEDIYKDRSDWDMSLMWWYRRMAKYFLELGIPADHVIEIMKKHPVSTCWVKRYQHIHPPELIAQNILKYRHDKEEHDSLAKPRIRVTKKKIADFRKRLEEELRRIGAEEGWHGIEDTVREFCVEESDVSFERMIKHGTRPESWARNIFEYL